MILDLPSELLLCPRHTCRPVDARWLRVTDLADRGDPANHEWDDEWVRRGLRYLNELRRCQADTGREQLAAKFPDLDAAHRMHTTADKLARGELEARLLTHQPLEEVAKLCALTAEAVVAYEALFFCVRDRLRAWAFILAHAFHVGLWDGTLTEDDADEILKEVGFLRGPLVLERFLHYFRRGVVVPKDIDNASTAELTGLAEMLEVRACVLARVLPLGQTVRAVRVKKWAEELRRHLAGLHPSPQRPLTATPAEPAEGEPDGEPRPVTVEPQPEPAYLTEEWWAVWQDAVLAA